MVYNLFLHFANYLARTFRHTSLTTVTFTVIYNGQVLLHSYRALRTVLRAKSATDTALVAYAHNVFAPAMRGTSDIHRRRTRYQFD